jgi:hypothetical protein
LDYALQDTLRDLFARSEKQTAAMVTALASALIKKGVVTADEILADYRSPALADIAPSKSASQSFESDLRRAQKEQDKS